MEDNYRMIEETKSRVVSRSDSTTVLQPEDFVAKIEYNSGRETYHNGFTDYHKK